MSLFILLFDLICFSAVCAGVCSSSRHTCPSLPGQSLLSDGICWFNFDHKFFICFYLWPSYVHDFSDEVSLEGVYFLFFIFG